MGNILKMRSHDRVVAEKNVFPVLTGLHVANHQVRDGADVITDADRIAFLKDVTDCVVEVATTNNTVTKICIIQKL